MCIALCHTRTILNPINKSIVVVSAHFYLACTGHTMVVVFVPMGNISTVSSLEIHSSFSSLPSSCRVISLSFADVFSTRSRSRVAVLKRLFSCRSSSAIASNFSSKCWWLLVHFVDDILIGKTLVPCERFHHVVPGLHASLLHYTALNPQQALRMCFSLG